MLTFLVLSLFVLAAAGVGGLALPLILAAFVVWLILLPIKLLFGFVFGGLFRLVFGVLGAVLGLILAPLVFVVVAIAIAGAFVAALLALITPLLPVALLALLGWGVYRIARPSPAI